MSAHHLSFSKVDLAAYGCAFWARPDVTIHERPSRVSGVLGTNVHAACEAFVNKTVAPAMTKDEAKHWGSLKHWMESEPMFDGMELPLLYDAGTDTAKLCELGAGRRDYLGVTPTTMPGTLDLHRLVPSESLVVVLEVKTGAHGNVEKEPDNMQLASQGVAVARYLGVERVRVGTIFTRKTKVRPPTWHELDANALDMHAGSMRRILKLIPDAEPNRGAWCWNCPIGPEKGFASTCPAWANEQEVA